MAKFCSDKVPEGFENQLRLRYEVRGNDFVLLEERPKLLESGWREMEIAVVRFHPSSGDWSLYYFDRNDRRHRYDGFDHVTELNDVIAEMDEDPTGIFWG